MNAPCVEGNRWNFCLWNPESWVLESGIQLKGSGIPLTIAIQNPSSNDKYWNPVPRIQNPQRGIQNPRLCWIIPLHGVKDEYLYSIYVYITWIFEPRALSSTNYFSKSILRNSVTAGEVILFFDASLAWDQALEWEKKKKIGERTELKGSLRKGKWAPPFPPLQATDRLASFADIPIWPRFLPFSPSAEPGPGLMIVTLWNLRNYLWKTKWQFHVSNTSYQSLQTTKMNFEKLLGQQVFQNHN